MNAPTKELVYRQLIAAKKQQMVNANVALSLVYNDILVAEKANPVEIVNTAAIIKKHIKQMEETKSIHEKRGTEEDFKKAQDLDVRIYMLNALLPPQYSSEQIEDIIKLILSNSPDLTVGTLTREAIKEIGPMADNSRISSLAKKVWFEAKEGAENVS